MALALRELQLDYNGQQGTKENMSLALFNYARKDMAEQLMTMISESLAALLNCDQEQI